ncbi:MAG: redoxin domain-containing protein [Polaromonas sp.]
MSTQLQIAPALAVSQWLNADTDVSLDSLRGHIVVLHAFQMLCPACVSHGIPQAIKIYNSFAHSAVVVLGLHTVFEHHAAMGPASLKAFVHEYRIPFPVGIDLAVAGSSIPLSMQTYKLRGTPSLVVIDRNGYVRLNHFGHLDDMLVGSLLGQLI